MLTHFTDLVQGSWRYATGLREFLSKTLDLDEARTIITNQLQHREESFLSVLKKSIYASPRSPYRRLLEHAGYEFDDIQALVREEGLQAALSKLYDDGVYVTLDEFKGRTPIRRPGLEFDVREEDFENPDLAPHFQSSTGGSRSSGTRVPFHFDFIADDAAACLWGIHANAVADRPLVLSVAAPPSTDGLFQVFRLARAGHMPRRWFSPNRPGWNRQAMQGRALMIYTLMASRLFGRSAPRPEYTPDVARIVDYLADLVRNGTPALMRCMGSQAVRVCLAAERAGSDISGTVFYCGGEPLTAGKAAVMERVGARGIVQYGMSESGVLGFRCGAPSQPDDMHVMAQKLAVLQRPKQVARGLTVQVLYVTLPLTSAPKLMLNVESGDCGVIEQRDCGCAWQDLGLTTHIHTVRSYEKLSSEGVMFMGSMLYEVLEETLPSVFGGGPADYQLVEEEEDGLPRVTLLVAPRVGPVDEDAVVETFFRAVSFSDWSRRQADQWRHSGTLRVRRREPYGTRAGKTLPLHVLGTAAPADS
jgi:hypothetical protein